MLIWGNHMSENSDNMKLITEDQIKEITPEEAAQELAPAAEAKAPAKPAKASKKKACDIWNWPRQAMKNPPPLCIITISPPI